MNNEQSATCKIVMDIIYRRPVSRIFLESASPFEEDSTYPITLRIISEKIDKNIYKSAEEWVSDMRRLFMNGINNSKDGSIRKNAAKLLSSDFEKSMERISPSISPYTIKLQHADKQFRDFLQAYQPECPTPDSKNVNPKSLFFSRLGESAEIADIIHDIRLIQTPEILLRISAELYSLQPEALSFQPNLVLNFSLSSKQTLAQLRSYINKLALDAASGRVDPLVQVPKSNPPHPMFLS